MVFAERIPRRGGSGIVIVGVCIFALLLQGKLENRGSLLRVFLRRDI